MTNKNFCWWCEKESHLDDSDMIWFCPDCSKVIVESNARTGKTVDISIGESEGFTVDGYEGGNYE